MNGLAAIYSWICDFIEDPVRVHPSHPVSEAEDGAVFPIFLIDIASQGIEPADLGVC